MEREGTTQWKTRADRQESFYERGEGNRTEGWRGRRDRKEEEAFYTTIICDAPNNKTLQHPQLRYRYIYRELSEIPYPSDAGKFLLNLFYTLIIVFILYYSSMASF